MSWFDWAIVGAYLAWVVWDGVRLSRNTQEMDGYLLASRSLPWCCLLYTSPSPRD